MKNLYTYSNYRDLLNDLVYGPDSRRGLQTQIAKAMGCQGAYLFQVLKEKAELTEDHAIKLANHLGFDENEADYFILLVRISRSASPDLRKYLEAKRETLQKQSQNLEKLIQSSKIENEKILSRYFASWLPSTIHVATSSESFQTAPKLAARLRLPLETVEKNLKFLEQAGLVRAEGGKWIFSGDSLHLPKKSSLNEAHQTGRRMQALRSIQEDDKDALHLASIFTLDKEAFDELKAEMVRFIEKSHKKIHESGSDDLYSFCLDFFRVV